VPQVGKWQRIATRCKVNEILKNSPNTLPVLNIKAYQILMPYRPTVNNLLCIIPQSVTSQKNWLSTPKWHPRISPFQVSQQQFALQITSISICQMAKN